MSFYADGSVMGESVKVVTEKLKDLKLLSDRYNGELSKVLADIGNIKMDNVPPPQQLSFPSITMPSVDMDDDVPIFNPKGLDVPTMPVLYNLDALLGGLDDIDVSLGDMPSAPSEIHLDLPQAPTLKDIATPDKPSMDLAVNLPTAPVIERINLPVRPNIDTDIDLPTPPDMTLPEMARLFDISVPVWDEPILPEWDESSIKQLNPALFNFNHDWWAEDKEYQSDLYNKLLITAKNMLDPTKIGNFGLPDGVVNALFNKPRERLARETKRAMQETTTRWASRGFSLPSGVLDRQISTILDDEAVKVSELNTEIFVNATKEQMEQLRFAITQGLALEQHTFNVFYKEVAYPYPAAEGRLSYHINTTTTSVKILDMHKHPDIRMSGP